MAFYGPETGDFVVLGADGIWIIFACASTVFVASAFFLVLFLSFSWNSHLAEHKKSHVNFSSTVLVEIHVRRDDLLPVVVQEHLLIGNFRIRRPMVPNTGNDFRKRVKFFK